MKQQKTEHMTITDKNGNEFYGVRPLADRCAFASFKLEHTYHFL